MRLSLPIQSLPSEELELPEKKNRDRIHNCIQGGHRDTNIHTVGSMRIPGKVFTPREGFIPQGVFTSQEAFTPRGHTYMIGSVHSPGECSHHRKCSCFWGVFTPQGNARSVKRVHTDGRWPTEIRSCFSLQRPLITMYRHVVVSRSLDSASYRHRTLYLLLHVWSRCPPDGRVRR